MSVNKVIFVGRLGADPSVKGLPDGTQSAVLNLATTERWKDRTTGERKEKTEWHRVVFYGGLAKIVGEYLKKGSQIKRQSNFRGRQAKDTEMGR